MPVINRFAELHDEIAGWRRDFHRHPELQYDVHRTAASVASKLREFGCDEVAKHGKLELVNESAEPWSDWPGTRYQAKAARAGRGARYFTFRKVT